MSKSVKTALAMNSTIAVAKLLISIVGSGGTLVSYVSCKLKPEKWRGRNVESAEIGYTGMGPSRHGTRDRKTGSLL